MIYGVFLEKKKNRILLIGASGTLGSALKKNNYFHKAERPSKNKLNILNRKKIENYLNKDFQIVINCAAISKVRVCESNKKLANKVNVFGVKNLVNEIINYEKKTKKQVLFIHLSSDAVYPHNRGNNKEISSLSPYNFYGKTKFKSEQIVKKLKKFIIIRTRFFDKKKIRFKDAATDIFSSMIEVEELVKNIIFLIKIRYNGVINVGGQKQSDYDFIKKFNKQLLKTTAKEIFKKLDYKIAIDASLNITLFKNLKKRYEKI